MSGTVVALSTIVTSVQCARATDIREERTGYYKLIGKCSEPKGPIFDVRKAYIDIIDKENAHQRRFFGNICGSLNCDVSDTAAIDREIKISLYKSKLDIVKFNDPYDSPSLDINFEGQRGVIAIVNDAPGTYQDKSRSSLKSLFLKKFERCSTLKKFHE